MRARFLIIIVSALLTLCSVSLSQDDADTNLLTNGDFEGEFETLEGSEPRKVAEGWMPWHLPAAANSPSFANHNPNYDEETDRIRLDEEGKAQKYFTLFATHQGGIYQEVDDLSSGTTYRFSIYAHIWSSSFDELDESENPGDVVLRVGIDPDGGTDGSSNDIIWSTAATFFYDAYRQYAVIATAETSSITVFVESTVGEPAANNYIYLDDAVLEVASETVTEVEQTPTPETNTDLIDSPAVEEPSPSPTATPTNLPASIDTATPGEDNQEATTTEEPSPTPTATATTAATATATATATLPTEQEPDSQATVEVDDGDDDSAEGTLPISDEFPETIVHVVVVGDTVSALAIQYSSTIDAINRANGLSQSNLIVVGQRLIVPVNLPPATELQADGTPILPTATATPTSTHTPTMTPTPTATPITYQVLPGDTLGSIAQRYGTTVQAIVERNAIFNQHQIDVGQILVIPTPVPPTPTPTPLPTATPAVNSAAPTSYMTHVVQPGDILGEIARSYNTTAAALAQLNGITNPSRIFPGQELQIPVAGGESTDQPIQPTPTPYPTSVPITYIVQPGDTLYLIAAVYGVSIVELAQLNNIYNYNILSVGQVLTIPG